MTGGWSKVASMNGRDWVPRDEAEEKIAHLERELRYLTGEDDDVESGRYLDEDA